MFIFLDVGDTLLKLSKDPGQIYFDILKKHNILSHSISYHTLSKFFFESWKEMNQNLPTDFQDRYAVHPEGNDGWWKDLISLFAGKAGYASEIPEIALAEIFSEFDSFSTWQIEPGFAKLEAFAKENRIGLGIISNWDIRLRGLLDKIGLLSKFEHVIISSEFGYEKPSPKIFLEGMRLSGREPTELIYVGDKTHLDYAPTQELGWSSFLLTPKKVKGYRCIKTLSDIINCCNKNVLPFF
jgi:2-haloacid dehalogenase